MSAEAFAGTWIQDHHSGTFPGRIECESYLAGFSRSYHEESRQSIEYAMAHDHRSQQRMVSNTSGCAPTDLMVSGWTDCMAGISITTLSVNHAMMTLKWNSRKGS